MHVYNTLHAIIWIYSAGITEFLCYIAILVAIGCLLACVFYFCLPRRILGSFIFWNFFVFLALEA